MAVAAPRVEDEAQLAILALDEEHARRLARVTGLLDDARLEQLPQEPAVLVSADPEHGVHGDSGSKRSKRLQRQKGAAKEGLKNRHTTILRSFPKFKCKLLLLPLLGKTSI